MLLNNIILQIFYFLLFLLLLFNYLIFLKKIANNLTFYSFLLTILKLKNKKQFNINKLNILIFSFLKNSSNLILKITTFLGHFFYN